MEASFYSRCNNSLYVKCNSSWNWTNIKSIFPCYNRQSNFDLNCTYLLISCINCKLFSYYHFGCFGYLTIVLVMMIIVDSTEKKQNPLFAITDSPFLIVLKNTPAACNFMRFIRRAQYYFRFEFYYSESQKSGQIFDLDHFRKRMFIFYCCP